MNKLLLVTMLFIISVVNSQNKKGRPYFTGDFNFTLGINEEYELFNNDDEDLVEFSGVMLRMGAGYQFDERWAASFNIGYDHHSRFNINSIPTYGTLRYTITGDDYDNIFAEAGYGKLWRPSPKFDNGNYYKIGLGAQLGSTSHWHLVLKLDFHRKEIAGFRNGHLDSVSLGIGFSFF